MRYLIECFITVDPASYTNIINIDNTLEIIKFKVESLDLIRLGGYSHTEGAMEWIRDFTHAKEYD